MFLKNFLNALFKISSFQLKTIVYFCNTKITNNDSTANPISKAQTHLNSIMPANEQGYAYGHYFPKHWSEEYIRKVLDPTLKEVERVSIVKSKVGEATGKILIKFTNEKVRTKYIQKYHEDFIMTQQESQKVIILPFELKTEKKKKQVRQSLNLKYGVRISNLDFDITKEELNKLAADYGIVTHIDLNLRLSGINRGFATVYFEQWAQANQFVKFMDGFLYRDRRFKAHLMQKKQTKQDKQFLKVPTLTFKANEQLMKRIKAKEYEHIN